MSRGDESHLPLADQSLRFRLRKRAEIRRANTERKSVVEGKPDRIADLLEEADRELGRADAFADFVLRHTTPERVAAHGAGTVHEIIKHHPFAKARAPFRQTGEQA